jgi:hypothetical protein
LCASLPKRIGPAVKLPWPESVTAVGEFTLAILP